MAQRTRPASRQSKAWVIPVNRNSPPAIALIIRLVYANALKFAHFYIRKPFSLCEILCVSELSNKTKIVETGK
jgi:hypothetical protein